VQIDHTGRGAQAYQAADRGHVGIDASGALQISAKTGLSFGDVLEAVATRLPPPEATRTDR
jgi:translation elongation factor EF-4